ncbi:hypothetical protein RDV89_12695 [Nocardioides zeae]|uniref:TerD domain-containing protein n=1 Tax=Nocardioides imazamoxiresistens TaxID=3231893 RepID=A0ABU3PXG3_9ACTN|nr:hypothetical protein [Nocardioides zeae]MDT9593932.1 hypothetical protein [Nocardioides zeae]
MTALVPGQNVPWPHPGCRVEAPGRRMAVLALGADDRALTPDGLLWSLGDVRLALTAVPDTCARLVVLGLDPGALRLQVHPGAGTGADAGAVVTFDLQPEADGAAASPGGETVVALVELYRRGSGWKLRAVGRAYGSAADVERLHGVRMTLPQQGEPAARPAPPAAPPAPPTPPTPPPSAATPATQAVDPDRAVQLIGMVLEDAARSSASYSSSVTFADEALERDEAAIVADASLRVSAAGDAARAAARARRDDLVARAGEAHLRDLVQLGGEMAEIERSLPPALSRWETMAPASAGAGPVTALRAGELGPAHLADLPPSVPGGDFRVPLVWRVPGRPLVVSADAGGDRAATQVATGIAVRAVAALAPHRPRLVVADLGSARGDLGLPPAWVAPVTSPPVLTSVLRDLVARAELIDLARSSAAMDALDAELLRPVVLVLLDAPTAWEAETLPLVDQLVTGPPDGVQVVLTGSDEAPRVGGPAEQRLLASLWSSALRLPSGPGGRLADAFAGTAWSFRPDLGPEDPAVLHRTLGALAPFDGWRDGLVPHA